MNNFSKPDPAHDILQGDRLHPLDAIFAPKSIALIGATEKAGTVGYTLIRHLCSDSFKGVVYPVNPKRSRVLGTRAFPDIASIPEKVDLAVIVTPATTVPGLIGECIDAVVK